MQDVYAQDAHVMVQLRWDDRDLRVHRREGAPWQVGAVGHGVHRHGWVCLGTRQASNMGHHVCPLSGGWGGGGAYTCGAGGLAPLRPRQPPWGCPRLSLFLPGLTGPKIELVSGAFMALCPLNWEPRVLCEPRVARLHRSCLGEGLDADDHRGPLLLCTNWSRGRRGLSKGTEPSPSRGMGAPLPPSPSGEWSTPSRGGGEGPARQPWRQWLPATRLPPINSAAWREA